MSIEIYFFTFHIFFNLFIASRALIQEEYPIMRTGRLTFPPYLPRSNSKANKKSTTETRYIFQANFHQSIHFSTFPFLKCLLTATQMLLQEQYFIMRTLLLFFPVCLLRRKLKVNKNITTATLGEE